jgi:hypothetical protein
MKKMTFRYLATMLALAIPMTCPAASKANPAADGAAVYQKVADTILAADTAEDAVVRSILHAERDAAMAALDRAGSKTGTIDDVKMAADRIGDFATEGGSAVEPIRSRLLQGGHHHHADDTGAEAVYDEGYVVLTRKIKQEALDLAKRGAKCGAADKVDVAEVTAIREAFSALATRALATK